MKKALSLFLALVMVLSIATVLAGCNKDTAETTYEIALITDVGTIDDKSFNQGSWEGIVQYANESGKTYKYYQPKDATIDTLLTNIELAIDNGAKIVVCPGFNFEIALYQAQTKYPDTTFIFIDGEPHDEEYNYETKSNLLPIMYSEQEAGFLAGYACVKDGYKKFGFMGGMSVPAVVRFGYGYVQGIDYAAKEMNLDDVEVKYTYTGSFDATPEAKATAAGWYQSGTEIIFGCGGQLGNSVFAAADEANKKSIGVDVDQSSESDTVITSATKNLKKSVYDALKSYYDGSFVGGKTLRLDTKSDGVGITMDNARFNSFTQEEYDAIYAKVKSGEITVLNDEAATSVDKLENLEKVKVTVIG